MIPVETIWPREAAGAACLPVSISFTSRSRIAIEAGSGSDNGNRAAFADFGRTLRWMYLDGVTNADGTPFTGSISVTSASGFDYTIPGPGAAGIVLLGCAGGSSLNQRRRR